MRRKLLLAFFPLLLAATFGFAPPAECGVEECLYPKLCPGYPACTNWSSYSPCGAILCETDTTTNPITVRVYQRVQSFRWCFNQLGESCKEYKGMKILIGQGTECPE
jgi:hypothetical protein